MFMFLKIHTVMVTDFFSNLHVQCHLFTENRGKNTQLRKLYKI